MFGGTNSLLNVRIPLFEHFSRPLELENGVGGAKARLVKSKRLAATLLTTVLSSTLVGWQIAEDKEVVEEIRQLGLF